MKKHSFQKIDNFLWRQIGGAYNYPSCDNEELLKVLEEKYPKARIEEIINYGNFKIQIRFKNEVDEADFILWIGSR